MQISGQAFIQKLESLKALINEDIYRFLDRERPASLYEPMRYTVQGGGKKLRPILLLLSTESLGGEVRNALPAASAIELLHNFTLVHDDIMDNDDTRRGRQTVHQKWDVATALLAGDGLVAVAYKRLLETHSPRLPEILQLFTNGIIELCEGQALDKEFETRDSITMADYMEMISKKTACLLSLCTQIGGIVAGAGRAELEGLKQFGECLGRAFQIQDDVLDITTDESLLGKDFGSDVKSRKKTFLLIHALEHANAAQMRAIQRILAQDEIRREQILAMRNTFETIGSIHAAKRAVEENIAQASSSLQHLQHTAACESLMQFLQLVLHRRA